MAGRSFVVEWIFFWVLFCDGWEWKDNVTVTEVWKEGQGLGLIQNPQIALETG